MECINLQEGGRSNEEHAMNGLPYCLLVRLCYRLIMEAFYLKMSLLFDEIFSSKFVGTAHWEPTAPM
jgi:hypothetical protein